MHKSKSEENCGSPTCAAEIIIADKYKVTVKGEPFLLFDSGFGDVNRMILFANQKFFSLLSESETWYADGTFKVVPEYFFQLYTFMQREMDSSTLALLPDKAGSTYNRLLTNLLEIQPQLDPSTIMTHFEKAAINVFEDKFLAVIRGASFISPKMYIEKYNQRG